MRIRALLFCFFLIALRGFSQDKTVSGLVFDKESKARLASVNIHNITTGIAVYDNLKGVFTIKAALGDRLVITRQDYLPDTVKVQNNGALAVYMDRKAIQLRLVTVHDSLLTPQQRLEATKHDYSKIYGSLAYDGFITSPTSGGAGLSIDALYNALSAEGRGASRLRQIIQQDYEQNVIDYRFNRTFVGNITGLKDAKLTAFMFRFRPGYYTTTTLSDYEFISMILNNLKRYRRNQRTYSLPPLVAK
ncbi:MAG TPA: hypothetical protein DCO83_15140 [Mucilaginibacter sp.]|jgi:hypothetical protein|nr:hypothetical protein [Mucilaginibacter sp.]